MVVVVVDRHADVVEHARRPQQFPLTGVAGVQAEASELVEHAERERGHVAGVLAVGPVLGGHVEDALPAHVGEQRRLAVGEQPLQEHALAQPGLGGLEAAEGTSPEDRLDDEGSGEDQVGAGGLDPGHARPLGRGQRGETAHEPLEHIGLDHHALDPVAGQACRPLRRGGEVAGGAADPHQAPRRARGLRQPASLRGAPRRHARAAARSCRRLAGPFGGRKRSLMRTVPSRQEPLS